MNYLPLCLALVVSFLLTSCGPDLPEPVAIALEELPQEVDFNQHIRPILSDRCWSCHGPDEGSRQAGLRLDVEVGVFHELTASGRTPVVPGRPAASELVRRILSDDPEVIMPTPGSHLSLSDREKALLVRWIEDGAEWKDHWAFLPIEPPTVPANPVGYPEVRTPVDNFVHASLAEVKLAPAAPADPEILLRRLYLDLTGLPPTLDQVDDFLADPSDERYRKLVEELLATDAYAERMTLDWMDVARYADSHGLHADGLRTSWPYRDWLIRAFRDNMPYDQFIRWQLAGDLIDEPTRESILGTAFLRMHPMTSEGGAIDEEWRLANVFDRVNTVATGLLGLTMDCARCHDHKFDPLSQEEYYSFSAFFNTINELGMGSNDGEYGPLLVVSDPATNRRLDSLTAEGQRLDEERRRLTVADGALREYMAQVGKEDVQPDFELTFDRRPGQGGGPAYASDSFSLTNDPERGSVGLWDHSYDLVDIGPEGRIHINEPMSATLWVSTDKRETGKEQDLLCTSGDKENHWRGLDFFLDTVNRLSISLAHRQPDDLILVRTIDSLRVGEWYHVAFSYDGSGVAGGVRLYVNGKRVDTHTEYDALTGTFMPLPCHEWQDCDYRTMRLGRSYRTYTGDDAIFRGRMDDLRIYYRELDPATVARQYGTDPAKEDLRDYALRRHGDYRFLTQELQSVQRQREPYADTVTRISIMREMERPRKTYLLDRGAYDAPRREVRAGTPDAVLPWSTQKFSPDRAGLADWLLAAENPLTARVAVNRYWQLFFGVGLVSTPQDFGSQGALPTHPKLLDYLAARFRTDWDVRELIRLVVLSDTYRRSSVPTEEQLAQDPENLLLARAPRFRLPAETIRDNALAASGLLNRRVGGQSVKPYQPKGLWFEKLNFSQALLHYEQDHGDSLYRRSMYTFIRRNVPPPFMTNFDASGRDVCIVKRQETNTPLQALNLLNDPQFVEAARVLADRVQREAGPDAERQLRHAYRLVTGRRSEESEVALLAALYREELERFRQDLPAADTLLSIGEYPRIEAHDPAHTAALTSVSNMLFSLDAAYVKY